MWKTGWPSDSTWHLTSARYLHTDCEISWVWFSGVVTPLSTQGSLQEILQSMGRSLVFARSLVPGLVLTYSSHSGRKTHRSEQELLGFFPPARLDTLLGTWLIADPNRTPTFPGQP